MAINSWFKTKEEADRGYGILHREDGPAIEAPNGYKVWYINGRLVTEQEFEAYRMRKATEAWNG